MADSRKTQTGQMPKPKPKPETVPAQAGEIVHGTAVADSTGKAVLLRGPSGSGKSDLALRLMDRGWRLVADDRVVCRAVALPGGVAGVRLSSPPAIAGRMELRGLGIVEVDYVQEAALYLVIDLAPEDRLVARMPEERFCRIADADIPAASLWPFAASAPLKVEALLARLQAAFPATIGKIGAV